MKRKENFLRLNAIYWSPLANSEAISDCQEL